MDWEIGGRRFIRDVLEILPDIEIVAVTDTYVQESAPEEYTNIPYISPECIQKYEYDCIIVTPGNFYQEITSALLSKGVDRMKIKSLEEFQKGRKGFCCNICGSEIFAWEYIGEDYAIFQNKSIAGAGKRRGGCTVCGSYDRARFVYDIMKSFSLKFEVISKEKIALIGSNYLIIFLFHFDDITLFYINRNEKQVLEKININNFVSASIDSKDREGVFPSSSIEATMENNLKILSRSLKNHWSNLLIGKKEWIEDYQKSKFFSDSQKLSLEEYECAAQNI